MCSVCSIRDDIADSDDQGAPFSASKSRPLEQKEGGADAGIESLAAADLLVIWTGALSRRARRRRSKACPKPDLGNKMQVAMSPTLAERLHLSIAAPTLEDGVIGTQEECFHRTAGIPKGFTGLQQLGHPMRRHRTLGPDRSDRLRACL